MPPKRKPPRWIVECIGGRYENAFDKLTAAERCAEEQSLRHSSRAFVILDRQCLDLRHDMKAVFYHGQKFLNCNAAERAKQLAAQMELKTADEIEPR